ncbi:MAG TPA: hypothetical protein VM307_09800 [Egibacteraceae bacterium]|nr:hypothetical protein [Egibacteraceae bacterium]
MTGGSSAGDPKAGVGTFIGWAYSEATTQHLARRTQELLRNRDYAKEFTERYKNALPANLQGRVFEWLESLKFNLDAAEKGSHLRAVTTEEMGLRHAAADIRIRIPGGPIVREVQAKAYRSAASGVIAASQDKYRGMGRLVPQNQHADAERLLERVRESPNLRLNKSRYADVQSNLMGELRHGDITSGGTSQADLKRMGTPDSLLEQAIRTSKLQEIGLAAAKGATGSAAITLLFTTAHNALAPQQDQASASKQVIDTVAATTAAAVRGGTGAALAKGIHIAARNREGLQDFASTAGPAAIASAVVEIGEAGFRFSQGSIDRDAFVEACGTAVLKNSVAWSYGVVGQALIPVPVLGTVVGATVGYVTATAVIEGLKLAHAAAAEADAAEERLAEIEVWIFDAIQRLEETHQVVRALNEEWSANFEQTVLPLMDDLEKSLGEDTPAALTHLSALCTGFDASLPFATQAEFDQFIKDDDTILEL